MTNANSHFIAGNKSADAMEEGHFKHVILLQWGCNHLTLINAISTNLYIHMKL